MAMSAKKKEPSWVKGQTENQYSAIDWLGKILLMGDFGQRPDFREEECSVDTFMESQPGRKSSEHQLINKNK